MDDNRPYLVGFNLVKGIGAVRLQALVNVFGDAKTAWFASEEALRSTGLHSKLVANLVSARRDISLAKVMENINQQGITVLTWSDPDYPSRLREVTPSPPVLYIRGDIRPEDEWSVAIVGTRRATAYGRQMAARIAAHLARAGITVVSGLARGIDGTAHKTTLEQSGRTLAVLGSGVDRIYPPDHRVLATQVMENGALISDYPPGTAPEASNFPPRNRIISGLSMATVVIEAGKRSGALITAEFAAEQGREVFAVPGSVLSPQSRGTNRLIQEGAHILLDPQEILEILDLTKVTEQSEARAVLPSNPTEAQLFGILGHEPLHVDEIRRQTQLSIEDVTATLAMMELKGMVCQVGGMRYTSIREACGTYDVDEIGQDDR